MFGLTAGVGRLWQYRGSRRTDTPSDSPCTLSSKAGISDLAIPLYSSGHVSKSSGWVVFFCAAFGNHAFQ